MPWREVSFMDQRQEFVGLFQQPDVNRRELCRRFGISPKTAYKWLARAGVENKDWAQDRSRRPRISPRRSTAKIETAVLEIREAHPVWGARKIRRCLEDQHKNVPAASTVHAILARHGRVPSPAQPPQYNRFEHPAPNDVWQMDFKGRFPLGDRQMCHPLTMIDDHSRYALCLQACTNEQAETVQQHLERTFRRYGLPSAFLVDNGVPWGTCSEVRWTRLRVWLLKLGVNVIYARPHHPQTKGKNERFHRTLKAEVLSMRTFRTSRELQKAFDHWRHVYNNQRPHHSLGQEVPASRYRPSPRSLPSKLREPEYEEGAILRRAGSVKANISFGNRRWHMPDAFRGELLAIRSLNKDGEFGVFFGAHQIACINMRFGVQ
ncbi:Transposase InsO and inactivated derivatives [Afipia sp. GAS231]|nr:Transposase InsO and inactivated derivatives [Afipia sp. GAS231]SDO32971.1 Transposase InsO and inactivated derivatives [Afipia sp. GAS231]